jgi:glucan 1,3-beta-glucosidase
VLEGPVSNLALWPQWLLASLLLLLATLALAGRLANARAALLLPLLAALAPAAWGCGAS